MEHRHEPHEPQGTTFGHDHRTYPFLFALQGTETLLSRKTVSFVNLDDGLDVSGQVREHHIIRYHFLYHAKDIRRIHLTPLHVVTSAEPFRQ
jgi:hypothetical protein